MMRVLTSGAALAPLFLLAAATQGQTQTFVPGIQQQTYTFPHSSLTIVVRADVPGELQLLRGRLGRIEVTGRADAGLAAFGLAGRQSDELLLTAVGSDRVDYVVVVPERVRVRIRLPDRDAAESFSTMNDVGRYRWIAAGATSRAGPVERTGDVERRGPLGRPVPESGSSLRAPADNGRATLVASANSPTELVVDPNLPLRALTVRLGADEFRIAADRPLALQGESVMRLNGSKQLEPARIVLDLPSRTLDFTLRFGEQRALVVRSGRIESVCGPVLDQQLERGRRWITFTPPLTALACGQRASAR